MGEPHEGKSQSDDPAKRRPERLDCPCLSFYVPRPPYADMPRTEPGPGCTEPALFPVRGRRLRSGPRVFPRLRLSYPFPSQRLRRHRARGPVHQTRSPRAAAPEASRPAHSRRSRTPPGPPRPSPATVLPRTASPPREEPARAARRPSAQPAVTSSGSGRRFPGRAAAAAAANPTSCAPAMRPPFPTRTTSGSERPRAPGAGPDWRRARVRRARARGGRVAPAGARPSQDGGRHARPRACLCAAGGGGGAAPAAALARPSAPVLARLLRLSSPCPAWICPWAPARRGPATSRPS